MRVRLRLQAVLTCQVAGGRAVRALANDAAAVSSVESCRMNSRPEIWEPVTFWKSMYPGIDHCNVQKVEKTASGHLLPLACVDISLHMALSSSTPLL